MTKVVVDTNVFIASFFGGNPRKIIDPWKTGKIVICLSRPIVDEYVEVLARLGLQDEKELDELLQIWAEGVNTLFAASTPRLNVAMQDPDDNMFIECAVALKAAYIISGDKDLTAVGDYMGIKIVSPAGFRQQKAADI